jgi:hypothetical protein
MHRVIRKRSYFKVYSNRSPSCVQRCHGVIKRVMYIDFEIEKAAGREHTSDLLHDAPWIFSMIHHIIAQHYVKRAIAERQALTRRGNRTNSALPGGKQLRIMVSERIQAEPIFRLEKEDQTVSAAANL